MFPTWRGSLHRIYLRKLCKLSRSNWFISTFSTPSSLQELHCYLFVNNDSWFSKRRFWRCPTLKIGQTALFSDESNVTAPSFLTAGQFPFQSGRARFVSSQSKKPALQTDDASVSSKFRRGEGGKERERDEGGRRSMNVFAKLDRGRPDERTDYAGQSRA